MNKRILLSLGTLIVTGAVVVGGTGAFFSDTETSTGNVFTAGEVDLKVNHTQQTYNGVDCQTCGVSVYSSTDTQVVGANSAAVYQGSFPVDAALITNPNRNWLDESTVAPAEWIWVTPVVAAGDTTNNAEYVFADTFSLQGPIAVTDFNLSIASDNGYKLVLNGATIVDVLTVEQTFGAQNPLTTMQKVAFQAALIQNGINTIEITVRNKAGNTNPNRNPAGLIYKIDFTNEDCEAGVADFQQKCELWAEKDLATETFFNFSDIKPQDTGSNVISLNVTSNDAFACLNVVNKEDNENLINNPEDNSGDNTPEGEMGSFLTVRGFYSDVNGTQGDELFASTSAKDLGTIVFADSNSSRGPILGNTTEYIKLEWCMGDFNPDGTCDGNVPNINRTQTDSFVADLQFSVIQSRNNANYVCSEAIPQNPVL